jgi:hypothetical protein
LEDVFSDKEIKRMEFILRKHLTTKDWCIIFIVAYHRQN